MTALERQMAADAVALSKEHADRADVAEARLEALKGAVLKLADEARSVLSFPPADCTDACGDGPCNCSGKSRSAGWNLDPAKVREAITAALAGKEAGDDSR